MDERKIFAYRWYIFWLLAIAYLFVYFHRFALSVVAVDLDNTFHPSAGVMGFLGSAYFYCYAFMQFPAGLISDSLGPRRGVTFFLLIASFGSVLFGLAPGIKMAILGRILVGIGVSMVFIPTMKILSQWFRVTEFSFMAGLLNAMGGIGILIAAAPLAFITGLLGWRISFVLIGGLTIFIALAVWIIVRDKPADMGLPSIIDMDKGRGHASSLSKPISLWEGVRRVVSEPYFWPLAIWFFFDCGVFFGFGALWSGPYLMHVYGMSQNEAGAILSMIAVGMIGGSPLISLISDRVLKSRKKTLMFSAAGLIAVVGLMNLFPNCLSKPLLLLIFLLFSVFSSAIVAIGFTMTKELFPIEIAGTSIGTMNLFPFLGGAVFQPILGLVLDFFQKTGTGVFPVKAYSVLLLVLLAASSIAFFSTFFMKETFPLDRYKKGNKIV